MQILKGYAHNEAVWAVRFTPDGNEMVSVGSDGQILWWELSTGHSRKGYYQRSYQPTLAISPDGQCLVRGVYGKAEVLGRDDGIHPSIPLSCGRHVETLCFSPNGRVLAVSAHDLFRWDTQTWERLPDRWLQRGEFSTALAYGPDGETLAVAIFTPRRHSRSTGPYVVLLLDAQSGDRQAELRGPTGQMSSLAMSPDGRFVAAAAGQFLWIWEVATTEAVLNHRFDTRHFKELAFTPDGRHLLTVRNDETVRVWATDGWREQAAFDWDIGPLVSLDVAADGMRAATGSKKGRILIWDLDL